MAACRAQYARWSAAYLCARARKAFKGMASPAAPVSSIMAQAWRCSIPPKGHVYSNELMFVATPQGCKMTRVQSVTAAAQATQSVHQTWTVLLCVHARLAPLATGSPLAQVRADPFPVSFLYPLVSSLFLCMRASPLHKAIAPTCSLLGMAAGDQVQTTTCNDFDEELCPSSTNYVASSDVCDPTPCTFISCCGPVVAMLALGDSFQQAYARASCGGLCLFDVGGTSIAIPPLQPNKAICRTSEQC